MNIARIKRGINKAEVAGMRNAQGQVHRYVATGLSDGSGPLSPISCLDPPGDLVRPKFSNI